MAEHQTVPQVIRELGEEALLQASPALATVTAVDSLGAVKIRLLDEEASRPLSQARNPGVRLAVGDTVLVIRTLANDLVVVCPVTSAVTAPTIGTEQLVYGSVVQTKLATNSVGQAQLRTDAVTTDKIGAGAVTADKIQSNAVIAGKIAAGAVGNAQIAGGAVSLDKCSFTIPPPVTLPTQLPPTDNSVSTVKIQNFAVTTDKINTGAVTNEKIAGNTIAPSKLFDPSNGNFPFSLKGHTHGPGQIESLNWNLVKSVPVTVRNANGVQSNTTVGSVLSTLWNRSFGGQAGIAGV